MNSTDRKYLIRDKISFLFGDENLIFQSLRLTKLIEAAHDNKFDASQSTIVGLLFTQNEILDLIDIGYLINKASKKNEIEISDEKVIKRLKYLRKRIGHWDEFPSHLHSYEWVNPCLAITKFFLIHDIYEWRKLVQCLFEAGIGNLSISESADSFNLGLDIPELYRLLDAVWLYKIIEGIETPA